MSAWVLILLALVAVPAYADSIEIVTDRGNVFLLDVGDLRGADVAGNGTGTGDGSGDGTGDGSGDGTAMINGMGLNSRIIHKEYGGSMIYGRGLSGTESSVRPYVDVDTDTRFIVSALRGDEPSRYNIPAFYHEYDLSGGTLVRSQSPDNILGYVGAIYTGPVSATIRDSGIVIEGAGRAILELPDYMGGDLVLTGRLSDGTTARIASSPYDLAGLERGDLGFLIYHDNVNPDTGSGPEPVPPRWRNANTPPTETRIAVLAGSAADSEKTGIFSYLQEASARWYHGKCCRGAYSTSGSVQQEVVTSLVVGAHPSGYLQITGDRDDPATMPIHEIARRGAALLSVNYNRVADYDYKIYDTLPVQVHRSLSGAFEEGIEMPKGTSYMVVDSAGGTSYLAGSALGSRQFFEAAHLPPDTGYRLEKDGRTAASGITSADGRISVPVQPGYGPQGIGGTLYLYGGSLSHVGTDPGTVAFDHVNGQVIQLEGRDRAYNVHAYVKVPVVGDVDVTGAGIGGLDLAYLDGRYTSGEDIHFPVIPPYRDVRLHVNGVPAGMKISDVLGATGLKIADPVASTISRDDPGGFVDDIESTAGAVTYMIAAADGNAKAHVRATVHGTSEITNTRVYELRPPPPPPPAPVDPLTTWIEVYVNGEPVDVGGKAATRIHFSDQPDEDHEGGAGHKTSYHTARFSYAPVTVTDTISVPVQEGDFVEFYFYSRIRAEGTAPPVPDGYAEISRYGSATATSVIDHASINTSL